MEIKRSAEIKKTAENIWRKFLLAEVSNDLVMEEIRNRLYLEHIDSEWLFSPAHSPRDTCITRIAELAFGDAVENAIYTLYDNKKEMAPYSELTSMMDANHLYDALLQCIADGIHFYESGSIRENPYYQKIHIRQAVQKNITLTATDYLPYEFFQTYHRYNGANPFLYADIGFFREKVSFPVILENKEVWMSVVLSEVQSMEQAIADAEGNVITYGLGLGYYAFMAAEKDSVGTVTVIEKNPVVISLFRENLLPQFPHKEKIRIIEADALEFIETQKDGEFDTAFSDFWSGYYDGLDLYLKFMPKTARFTKTKHAYWIETCFLEQFFRPVVMKSLMKELLGKKIPLNDPDRRVPQVQKRFESYLGRQHISISADRDIHQLLSDESILKLMHGFAVENQ